MNHPVIEAFFVKWEAEFQTWFAERKAEYDALGYSEWLDTVRPGLSKQNAEMIKHFPLEKQQGCTSIADVVEKDMAIKKATLYSKIAGKVGEVLEVNLYCGEDGTPNGTVKGTAGTVRISTVVAGGYNVQCLHYRVLVK